MGNGPIGCTPSTCSPAVYGCAHTCHGAVAGVKTNMSAQSANNQKLIQGAREGNVLVVDEAIKKNANLETRKPLRIVINPGENRARKKASSGEGMTPLMYAANGGHVSVVRQLLEAKAKVNAEDQDGLTPLHFAALSGTFEVCEALIEFGAAIDAIDEHSRQPLDYLSEEMHGECVIQNWREKLLVQAMQVSRSSKSIASAKISATSRTKAKVEAGASPSAHMAALLDSLEDDAIGLGVWQSEDLENITDGPSPPLALALGQSGKGATLPKKKLVL